MLKTLRDLSTITPLYYMYILAYLQFDRARETLVESNTFRGIFDIQKSKSYLFETRINLLNDHWKKTNYYTIE